MAKRPARRDQPTRYPGVYLRDGVLYYRFWNEHGKKQRVRFGVGSPKAANLARLEAMERVALIRAGQLDPREDERRRAEQAPIQQHVDDYVATLRGRRRSAEHVKAVHRHLNTWVTECGIVSLATIRAESVLRWLDSLDVAARTRNYYRSSILGFCRWATDYERCNRNPCPSSLIPLRNEATDRRNLPRAMTPEEFDALIVAAPPERRAFYLLAGMTGLRWREAARLEWSAIDLEAGTLTVRAGWSKTGREATLPLLDRVRDALAAVRVGYPLPGVRVFRSQPTRTTWLRDLHRAGIIKTANDAPICNTTTASELEGYVDNRGRMLTKGSLRLSFNTWMARRGVPLPIRQRLMRHSTPVLTAITYDDASVDDLRAGVATLNGPHMVPDEKSKGSKSDVNTC